MKLNENYFVIHYKCKKVVNSYQININGKSRWEVSAQFTRKNAVYDIVRAVCNVPGIMISAFSKLPPVQAFGM